MFKGTFTALVTPFNQGRFDVARYAQQIGFQARHKVTGIVAVGTTGESPTLSHQEHPFTVLLPHSFGAQFW
jgi:4-hydroxy-tetrahydrodipicolinate synthase